MTKQLQQTLRDSAAARWTALIIVSLTMMMGYFFTDVMGPLEAPLTTKGKIVYFSIPVTLHSKVTGILHPNENLT